MEDIDKLQEEIEHIDALIYALLPFMTGNKHHILLRLHHTLEPFKHIKEMMRALDMVRNIQSVMGDNENGNLDFSKLSNYLSPEQIQMFEMFQTMQEINI